MPITLSFSTHKRSLKYTLFAVVCLMVSTASATCTKFNVTLGLLSGAPNDESYTTSSTRSYRVSGVVDCTTANTGPAPASQSPTSGLTSRCNSTQCALTIPPNFLVNIESQLNITVSDEQKQQILALVKDSTPQLQGRALYDFNSTMTVSLGGSQTCIPLNTSQYWGYTPSLRCAEGVLSGCSGSDSPADGTAIRACGADYFVVNARGLGQTTVGPNVVLAVGLNATDGPANATLIQNPGPSTGDAVVMRSTNSATFAVVVAAMLFALV